jgi:hypothetical protein
VWLPGSTGFELTATGWLPGPGPDASSCPGDTEAWSYDVASQTITRTGCFDGNSLAAAVVLLSASAAELLARVSTFRSKGPSQGCGLDGAAEVLTVLGPGAVQRSYPSDFSGGSNFDAGAGPFIADVDLQGLIQDLSDYLVVCTPGDGGPDAGAGID